MNSKKGNKQLDQIFERKEHEDLTRKTNKQTKERERKKSNLPHVITKHTVQDPEKGLPHTGIKPIRMHTGLPHYIFHGLYKEIEAPHRWNIQS